MTAPQLVLIIAGVALASAAFGFAFVARILKVLS